MVTFKRETKIKTTELDKMSAVHERSNSIGDFIEWLKNSREPRLFICELDEDAEEFYCPHLSTEKLLAEYFKIDLNKLEEERRGLLEAIRQQNDKEDKAKKDKKQTD